MITPRAAKLRGKVKELLINRRGKLEFSKYKLKKISNHDFHMDIILTAFTNGIKFFYYCEGSDIYRVVSLQKSPHDCKIYRDLYYKESQMIDNINEEINQMFENGKIIYPHILHMNKGTVTLEIVENGEYRMEEYPSV